MNKLQSIVFQHPLLFSGLVMVVATALTEIQLAGSLTGYMSYQSAHYLSGIIEQGGVSILLGVLLHKLGMADEAGFVKPKQWKSMWLIWPIFVYSILNCGTSPFDGTLTFDTSKPGLFVLFFLLYVSVGFFEEIVMRSLVLNLMLRKWGFTRKGVYLAVLLSSSIFGLLHLMNYFMGRRTLLATVSQVIFGTFFGVFFAACFLRSKTVWSVIFAHALFDLCGNIEDIAVGGTFNQVADFSLQEAAIVVIVLFPLMLYGLFLLRKVDPIPQKPELLVET